MLIIIPSILRSSRYNGHDRARHAGLLALMRFVDIEHCIKIVNLLFRLCGIYYCQQLVNILITVRIIFGDLY